MILNLIIKPQSHIMIFYTKKKSCYVIKFKARIRVNNYDFLYLKHKKKKSSRGYKSYIEKYFDRASILIIFFLKNTILALKLSHFSFCKITCYCKQGH